MHTQEKILKTQANFKIFGFFFFELYIKKPQQINLDPFFFLIIGTGSEPQMPSVM